MVGIARRWSDPSKELQCALCLLDVVRYWLRTGKFDERVKLEFDGVKYTYCIECGECRLYYTVVYNIYDGCTRDLQVLMQMLSDAITALDYVETYGNSAERRQAKRLSKQAELMLEHVHDRLRRRVARRGLI